LALQITRNYKLWLAVSVFLAALAALITITTIQKYTGTVRIVAAKTDIQSTSMITGNVLMYKEILRMDLYPDAVTDPRQIGGMIAKGFIPNGTFLRASMFEIPTVAQMSGKIGFMGKNYRAVALPKQLSTTVASTLNEDDIVDIYIKEKEIANNKPKVTRIAEDVQVVRCRYGEESGEGVVLAIKEDEIKQVLPYFYETGNITFALKPKPEKNTPEKENVNLKSSSN